MVVVKVLKLKEYIQVKFVIFLEISFFNYVVFNV